MIKPKQDALLPLCPFCQAGSLHPTTRSALFQPHGKTVEVELLSSRCDACDTLTTRAAQHEENLLRLAARKVHYDGLLMGEEIFALRRHYGLSQGHAAKIFHKSRLTFSRYENEERFPDDSTTLLLKLALQNPDVMKSLADMAAVTLPLWAERCEDALKASPRDPGPKVSRAAKAAVKN